MKTNFLLICVFTFSIGAWGQSVGIGTASPNASAALDIKSTTKGILLPRMTTAQRNAIMAPAAGLLVFDLDKSTFYLYDGDQWLPLLLANNTLVAQAAGNTIAGDYFASAVAISGNYAIIGAPGKTVNSNIYQGSAYIFTKVGTAWQLQQELPQGDGSAGDLFGSAVAISGNWAVVGAYNKTVGIKAMQGACYVYKFVVNTWQMQKKLTALDGQANDLFGKSVSIDADTVVVGAPNKNVNSMDNAGEAYIFTNNGGAWTEQDLKASGGNSGDRFGSSVSIGYGIIAVGAPGINSFYPYILFNGSWAGTPKQTATDAVPGDELGKSVAVAANWVAVGAPNKTINGNANQGAVYVYSPTNPVTWDYTRITASDGAANDYFGSTVATNGNNIIIGSPNRTVKTNQNQGAAYLFSNNASV